MIEVEKIKIFCSRWVDEGTIERLTKEINAWLEQHPNIQIIERKVNTAASGAYYFSHQLYITAVFHYIE